MAFKMKGSEFYGKMKLNRSMDDTSRPDGRAGSSAFQINLLSKARDLYKKGRSKIKDVASKVKEKYQSLDIHRPIKTTKESRNEALAMQKEKEEREARRTEVREKRTAKNKEMYTFLDAHPSNKGKTDKQGYSYESNQAWKAKQKG